MHSSQHTISVHLYSLRFFSGSWGRIQLVNLQLFFQVCTCKKECIQQTKRIEKKIHSKHIKIAHANNATAAIECKCRNAYMKKWILVLVEERWNGFYLSWLWDKFNDCVCVFFVSGWTELFFYQVPALLFRYTECFYTIVHRVLDGAFWTCERREKKFTSEN